MRPMRRCPAATRCSTAVRADATSSMRAERKPSRSSPSSPTGRFELGERAELGVVEDEARDEHPVDPLAHRHHVEEPAAAVRVAEVVEQQVEPGVAQRRLDGGDDLGEEPPVDERDDEPDGRRPPAGQPGRERRGDVVELGGGLRTPGRGWPRRRRAGPRSARDTVAIETPACRATSSMLATMRRPLLLSSVNATAPGRWAIRARRRTLLADSAVCLRSGRCCIGTGGSARLRSDPRAPSRSTSGQITWVGGEDEARDRVGAARAVDLAGALVTPAFVDAHVHATATGLGLTGLDLRAAGSAADVLDRRRCGCPGRRRPADPGRRLGRDALGGPAGADARPIWTGPPTAVRCTWRVSTCTQRWCRPRSWPRCRSCGPRPASTRAGGSAGRRTTRCVPPRSRRCPPVSGRRRSGPRWPGRRSSASRCVHEMAGPVISSADDLVGVLALSAQEPVPEVIGYWAELRGIEAARDLGAVGAAGDLFIDGSLGSHTAALHAPYTDRPETSGALAVRDRRGRRAHRPLRRRGVAGRVPRDRRRRGRPGAGCL